MANELKYQPIVVKHSVGIPSIDSIDVKKLELNNNFVTKNICLLICKCDYKLYTY